MKIIQINTVFGDGSTGRTTKELHEALTNRGFESFVIFGNGRRVKNNNLFRSQTRLEYLINNVVSRLFDCEGFCAFLSTRRIVRKIKKINPDIIHLRNLHGHYINIPMFFNFLKKISASVFISLHDLWMFTGHCTSPYLYGCDKWKKECSHCPAIHDYPKSYFFDLSRKHQSKKRIALESIRNKLCVVGVSEWTKRMADSTGENYDTSFIYNWIDTNKFSPSQNIHNDDTINILCISSIWEENGDKFKDLMHIVDELNDNYFVTVVGHFPFETNKFTRKNMRFIPKLNSNELIKLYTDSDVYIHLSHSDTFGKVIAESLSCGTPVIAYDITAMSEMIEEGCGEKVTPFDLEEFVLKIKKTKKKNASVINKCRDSALSRFSYSNIDKTIELYKERASHEN